jgi:Tfp pilus assembly protein PilO
MNLKTSSKKTLIFLIILSIVGIGVWYGLFSYIKRTAEAASAIENQYQEKITADARDKSLKELLRTIDLNNDSLSTRVIDRDGTVSFLEFIESTAKSVGLGITMNAVKIEEEPTDKNTYEYLKLSFTTQGSWQDTYTFLSIVESLPYKSKINKVLFSQTSITEPSKDQKTIQKSSWKADYDIAVLKFKGKTTEK